MARYERNTAILAKIESSYGVDAAPSGAANAMLVTNLRMRPIVASNVDRDLARPYFGNSEQLAGVSFSEVSFDVELQSSGSMVAPTIPAWGPLVRACGLAETGSAGVRVEYTPVSGSFESVTIYYYLDGVVRKLLGARGNLVIKAGMGERPLLSFAFKGIDGGVSAASLPSVTLSAFKTPDVVKDVNTGDITLGCTYTAGTPAIAGGTVYSSQGIEIDLGNRVEHVPLLGGESVDIVDRRATARMRLDLSAANEVTFNAAVLANTLQAFGLQHGSAAGYKTLLFAPALQLTEPTYESLQGRVLVGFTGRILPVAGNDELRLVAA